MIAALVGFAVMAAGFMCFLPFYWLPVLCVSLGYTLRLTWKQTFKFAFIAAVLTIAMATYLDFMNQNLISKKIGVILLLPPPLVPALPGLLIAWIGVFFTQLGVSLRTILKK